MPHHRTVGMAFAAACLALTAGRLDAQMLSNDSREWRQLITMLGEPGEESNDFQFLGNSEHIQLMLPGRWVIQPWPMTYELISTDRYDRSCEFLSVSIEPSLSDPYTFTATLQARDESFTTHSIVWTGNNNFVHQAHLGATFQRLGIDTERFGLSMLYPTISRAATSWTYLPLNDNTILTTSAEAGTPMIMARCDAPGGASVSEQSLVDSCLAAVRESDFEGSAAEAATACGCIVTELMEADLDEALLAGIQSDFITGSDQIRAIDRGLYDHINDTCSP